MINQQHIPLHRSRPCGQKLSEEIRCPRVEVRQPVEPLRPWSLEFVTKAEIQRQSSGRVPGLRKIERPINLLSCGEVGNYGLGKEMVFRVAEVVSIAEQKIGKRKTSTRDSGQAREARFSGSTKSKGAAGDVGLAVVFEPPLRREAKLMMMMALQHGDV